MDFSTMLTWHFVIDFIIVSYLIYVVINFSKNTRILSVLKSVALIGVIKMLSDLLNLKALNFIIDQVMTWGVIAIVIIFQSEIRQTLEQWGSSNLFVQKKYVMTDDANRIEEIVKAIAYLAKRNIGALIVLEKQSTLQTIINSGVLVNGHISSQLLINLFVPNTPLHDGAVIIGNNKILAASCLLPLTQKEDIPQELGTRHRAAIGLSEKTDAFTIVVSEETGQISLANKQQLYRYLSVESLRQILIDNFVSNHTINVTLWDKIKTKVYLTGRKER